MKTSKLASVGFLVFASAIILFYGLRYLQNQSFQSSSFSFKVIFNDLQGLDISDDVRMLGKKIGRVSKTEIIGQKIAVEVTIDNSFAFKLPSDSDIEISQSDLMGSKFISIYPGKDNDSFILPGETISGVSAEVASLTEDISRFAKKINETYGQKQKEQVKSTISNIQNTSVLLEEFIESNMDVITPDDKENLHNLLLNINNISTNLSILLEEESDNLKKSIQNFNVTMEKMPSLSQDLSNAIADLKNIINKINSNEGSLGKIINNNEMYDNANGLITDARLLINDINENPTRWLRAYFAAKKEDKNK